MKRLVIVLACFVAICMGLYVGANKISSPGNIATTATLEPDKVYLFTKKGCPFCTQAISYIKKNHPDFQIEILDILDSKVHRDMAIACANRFNIPLNQLGTPLICMPDDVMLGWGSGAAKHFDDYVKTHQTQNK